MNKGKKQKFGIEIPVTFRIISVIRSVLRQITGHFISLEDDIIFSRFKVTKEFENLRNEIETIKKGMKK